jgi:hypothetical protein
MGVDLIPKNKNSHTLKYNWSGYRYICPFALRDGVPTEEFVYVLWASLLAGSLAPKRAGRWQRPSRRMRPNTTLLLAVILNQVATAMPQRRNTPSSGASRRDCA